MSLFENWLDFSNSMIPVFLLLLVGMVVCRIKVQKPSGWSILFGLLFGMAMVFGRYLDHEGGITPGNLRMWREILILSGASCVLVQSLWKWMEKHSPKRVVDVSGTLEKVTIKTMWLSAAIIFVCYFIVFLGVYPGFFVYDAQEEYMQVVTRNFTTHHPLFHVLLMGGIVQLGYKLTDSYNIGIAMYTLFQMSVLSVIFGYFIWQLAKRGLRKSGQLVLTLYLGLFPVLVMFSLCSAKDGLFTGMLLLMVLLLQDFCSSPETFFGQKGKLLLLGGTSLGMMLLRHNGFYALLVMTPFLLLFIWKTQLSQKRRQYLKNSFCYLVGILLLYVVVNQGLMFTFHAKGGEHQEMLTVPIMQMARVYAYEKDSLTSDEQQMLLMFLPEEALLRYTPKVSDGVKLQFQNRVFEEHRAEFFKLWLQIGVKHPIAYANAWFMTSYGFWYPDTIIDVYRGNTVFTYTYEDSSYFGYEVELPGVRDSHILFLDELYRKLSLEIFQQKIPVVSMLFSPGFLFWCMIFGLGFLLQSGHKREAIPYLLPVLVWLTFLLGPTYLVRYVVFLWVLVPLLGVQICAILTRDSKIRN